IESFHAHGDPRLEGVARTYLSEILTAAGEFGAAEREALAAAEMLSVAPSLRVPALGAVARARMGQGDAVRALVAAREAQEALDVLGEIEEGESAVRLVYVEALAATGGTTQARAVLETAHARLTARAARIEELAWRQRFLHDVPV